MMLTSKGPCNTTTNWGKFIHWFAKSPTTDGKKNMKNSKDVLVGHVAFYLYIKYLPIAVQCHLRSMFEDLDAHEVELQRAIKALKATKKELTLGFKYKEGDERHLR